MLRTSKASLGSVTVRSKSPRPVVCDLAGEHVTGSPEVHSSSSEKSTISVDFPLDLALQLWVNGIRTHDPGSAGSGTCWLCGLGHVA